MGVVDAFPLVFLLGKNGHTTRNWSPLARGACHDIALKQKTKQVQGGGLQETSLTRKKTVSLCARQLTRAAGSQMHASTNAACVVLVGVNGRVQDASVLKILVISTIQALENDVLQIHAHRNRKARARWSLDHELRHVAEPSICVGEQEPIHAPLTGGPPLHLLCCGHACMMMLTTTRHSRKVLQHQASPWTKETRTSSTTKPRLALGACKSRQLFRNVGISAHNTACVCFEE